MPFDLPLTIGPFSVDTNGGLSPRDGKNFPSFQVTWRNCRVAAVMRQAETTQDGPALALSVIVGAVPSTAGDDPDLAQARRVRVLGALRCLPGLTPPGWQVQVRADHRVAVAADIQLRLPVRAVSLIGAITGFLIALAPYLDMLDELGLAGAAPAGAGLSGTRKTWPG